MTTNAADPAEAFAAYGRAMAYVGMVEQIMRLALGHPELAKGGREGSSDRHIKRFRDRLLRKDFGSLLHLVVDKFKLPNHWLSTLKDAKAVRDNLAHNFWIEHIGYIRTAEGLSIISRHCDGLARHMELIAHDLLAELKVDLGHYVAYVEQEAHAPEVIKKWEQLLQEHESALTKDEADRGIERT